MYSVTLVFLDIETIEHKLINLAIQLELKNLGLILNKRLTDFLLLITWHLQP